MSGLRERLLRHKKPAQNIPQTEAIEPLESAADSGGDSGSKAETCEWAPIGAHMEHNEWGSFVLRRRSYDSSFTHGRYALDELIGQSDTLMSILLPGDVEAREDGLPHDQLLFLDTETTGLGIGAGNVPFMIGIGFYEGPSFIIEQMFIRHPGEELAMLHYLEEKLARHPYLVSYNGKTFDWPIIKNRYILNRMPSEPDIRGHLDFLYPSRSLWRHTLPSCRLGKVEEERLHVSRLDDVPGSLAPALYFQYLAERDVLIVRGVFTHNELDILSLAGLAVHFSHVLSGGFQLAVMELEEQYRLGIWLSKIGSGIYAEHVLEKLTARLFAAAGEEVEDYLLPMAQWYKQQHRYEEACRLWQFYLERKGDRSTASLEPFLELAMYYEHREKRLDLALHYASQALNKAWQRQSLLKPQRTSGKSGRRGLSDEERKQVEAMTAIEKRIERLQSKLNRSKSGKPKTTASELKLASNASANKQQADPAVSLSIEAQSKSNPAERATRRQSRNNAASGSMQYSMDSLI